MNDWGFRVQQPDAEANPTSDAPSAWLRVLILCTSLAGINYVVWRWTDSVNWSAWWIAVPLVLAETYTLVGSLLFGLTMWRLRRRPAPPRPSGNATVDVLVFSSGQPVDVVMATADAAQRIRGRHRTYIVDYDDRRELAATAAAAGIEYFACRRNRSDARPDSEAGSLNHALLHTDGEFFLVLNADYVPDTRILDRTLGYFDDPRVAVVQTPQHVREARPARFLDPVAQGRDGWDAATLGQTNAVLRREALMQLGVRAYVQAVEAQVERTVYTADKIIRRTKKGVGQGDWIVRTALEGVERAIADAWRALDRGLPLADITYRFQQHVDQASRTLVEADVTAMRADLNAIAALGGGAESVTTAVVFDDATLAVLAGREWSPLGALDSISNIIRAVDLGHDFAEPVLPMASDSVAENMTISMRLHARGWASVYHPEALAREAVPVDVGTALARRLRDARGAIHAVVRFNPLAHKGLSAGQRLMYLSVVWGYLAGFAALAYIIAPVVFLVFSVMPVQAYDWALFGRLIPFVVLSQLLLYAVGRGNSTRRERWHRLALFPVWITACVTALRPARSRRPARPELASHSTTSGRTPWALFGWQFAAMAALATAMVIGMVRLRIATSPEPALSVNLIWAICDLTILGVGCQAMRHRGQRQVKV